jgi:hypothetical protein
MKTKQNVNEPLPASDLFGLWECGCGWVNYAPAKQVRGMEVECTECYTRSSWDEVKKIMKLKPKPNASDQRQPT